MTHTAAQRLADLVVDAAELVVAFLGAGEDALRVGATCRRWQRHVRHHDAWAALLARVAPLKARELRRALAAEREAGRYSSSVDWTPHVSRYMRLGRRQRPAGWVTNRPQPCQAGSHGTAPAAIANSVSPSPNASTVRAVACALGQAAGAIGALFRRPKRCEILVIGLDCSGKTTLLYTLKQLLFPTPERIPSIGFSIERLELPHAVLSFFDVGTGASPHFSRMVYSHYCAHAADGIVFVVDADDVGLLDRARDELQKCVTSADEQSAAGRRRIPLLVLANKQDLPGALPAEAAADRLGFDLSSARAFGGSAETFDWCVQGAVGQTVVDPGVAAGFKWLASAIGPDVRIF